MEEVSFSKKSNLYLYVIFGLIFISCFLVWSFHKNNNEGVLKFVVLDIGQGDALYIESPTGVQIIVDGGPGNNLLKEITKVLPWYDRSVDMIFVTNPDSDHYEGFIKFLDKYSVGALVESGTTNTYSAFGVFQEKIKQKNIPKTLARRGQTTDIGGGAYIQILFPDRNVEQVSPNTGSIVMKLIYGDTSVLLQGDSVASIEQYLLELDGDYLKSDILKVGHHGSKTSSVKEYVEKVSPKWAVISSGKDNSYGHPHKEVLEVFNSLNVPAYNTCNNGALYFESDGKNFVMKNRKPKNSVVGCKF